MANSNLIEVESSDSTTSTDENEETDQTEAKESSGGLIFGVGLEAGVGVVGGEPTASIALPLKFGYNFSDKFKLYLDTKTIPYSQDPAAIGAEMGIFSTDIDKTFPDEAGLLGKAVLVGEIPISQKDTTYISVEFSKTLALVEEAYNTITTLNLNDPADKVKIEAAMDSLKERWPAFRKQALLLNMKLQGYDKVKASTKLTAALKQYKKTFKKTYPEALLIEKEIASSDDLETKIEVIKKEHAFMFSHGAAPMKQINDFIDKSNENSYVKLMLGQTKSALYNDLDGMTYDHGLAPKQLGTGGLHLGVEYKEPWTSWVDFKIKAMWAAMTGTPFLYGSPDKEHPNYSGQKGMHLAFDVRADFHIADWLDLGVYAFFQAGLSGKQAADENINALTYGGGISPVFSFEAGKADYDKKEEKYFQPKITLNPEFWIQNGLGFFAGGKIAYTPHSDWTLEAGGGYANHPGSKGKFSGNTEDDGNCMTVDGVTKCIEDVTPSEGNIGVDDIFYQQAQSVATFYGAVSWTPASWLLIKATAADEKMAEYESGEEMEMDDNFRVMLEIETGIDKMIAALLK